MAETKSLNNDALAVQQKCFNEALETIRRLRDSGWSSIEIGTMAQHIDRLLGRLDSRLFSVM